MPSRSKSTTCACAGFGTCASVSSDGIAWYRAAAQHEPVPHVAHEQLEARVTVEIDELHVGHGRRRRRVRRGHGVPPELRRVVARRRPRIGRAATRRRMPLYPAGDRGEVVGQGASGRPGPAPAARAGSRWRRYMRATASRHRFRGSTSGGGRLWHFVQAWWRSSSPRWSSAAGIRRGQLLRRGRLGRGEDGARWCHA